MSYRGRLTEAARDRIRAGGAELSATAWLLDGDQVNELVVDEVDVDTTSTNEYLILHCHTTDTATPGDVVRFDVALDQATALQILFSSHLDETRLRVDHGRESEPPNVDPPHVTGVGHGDVIPTRGIQITVDSSYPRGHSER